MPIREAACFDRKFHFSSSVVDEFEDKRNGYERKQSLTVLRKSTYSFSVNSQDIPFNVTSFEN